MKINFIDLQAQYKAYKSEIDEAMQRIVDQCAFIQGKEVFDLEKNLADYTGAKHCISCSSGTDALILPLMALDIQPGDEIITTPFTFFATVEVISLMKARPVFIDIDEKTFNIDVSKIEEKITSKTKGIMPVGLYGQPSDMDEINSIAKKHNLFVIEDAAQSFGAQYKGKKSCNLADFGATSFFPAKPLGCYGDGGAVFTNDDDLGAKMRSMMNHGQGERYVHKYVGINARLDALQAAILNVKLKYYDIEISKRHEIGKKYTEMLSKKDVIVPFINNDRTTVWAQYSIRVKNRDEVIKKLSDKQIPTAIHYPIPLYRQEALKYLNEDSSKYPVSEIISKEIMSLPMSPFLTEEQQNYIVENI